MAVEIVHWLSRSALAGRGRLGLGDHWPLFACVGTKDAFGDARIDRLWLVTVTAKKRTWLLGYLRKPTWNADAKVWMSQSQNPARIVDVTSVIAPARMSLTLAPAQVNALTKLVEGGAPSAKPVAKPALPTGASRRAIDRPYLTDELARAPIKHAWDNANPHLVYTPQERGRTIPALRRQIRALSPKTQFGVGIAHAEWIAHRLGRHVPIDFLFELIDKAWTALEKNKPTLLNYATAYSIKHKLMRWEGPTGGPVWETFRDLASAAQGFRKTGNRDELVHQLCCLADHVTKPARKDFRAWQRQVFANPALAKR